MWRLRGGVNVTHVLTFAPHLGDGRDEFILVHVMLSPWRNIGRHNGGLNSHREYISRKWYIKMHLRGLGLGGTTRQSNQK